MIIGSYIWTVNQRKSVDVSACNCLSDVSSTVHSKQMNLNKFLNSIELIYQIY